MVRTKNQNRGSKSKGSQMELSTYDSLKELYPDLRLTKELGYVLQFDLVSEREEVAIECKAHQSFSWNELTKLYKKLKDAAPVGYTCYLVFKGNRQPTLVMIEICSDCYGVEEFECQFGRPFIKHTGVKKQ